MANAAQAPVEQPIRNSWWRLQGIFFEPTETFRSIERKPTWVVPLVLMMLMSFASSYIVVNTIGIANIVEQQMASNPAFQRMTPEQRAEAMDQAVNGTFTKVMTWATPPLGPILVTLFTAVVFLLLLYLVGGDPTFKKVFSVTNHAFFVYTLITTVLTILVVKLAPDPATLDVRNLVQSNLGFLVNAKEAPVAAAMLSSVDVISFYNLFLLGLGLSVVGHRPFKTTMGGVIGVWILYVLIKIGWASMLG